MMAASAAGTHNIVPALSGVGDGAGAETPSSAAVAPKLDKVTSTTTKMRDMEGSKITNAFTIAVMVLLVFASIGEAQVGAPAPAPGPVAGATSLYVPTAFAAVAAIFVWLF
ncbi:hypothetical protein POM88_019801 [Heracleum sosnowskyi]|uniref:Uncharacterized protein n=1 Tax=Heracleum sosnowskyi TaxID=360622 RepID=A0AAD8MQV9_9APIA|nr:hypothetical protein POM88_019801 [Heracleum sosnowskyi]